MATLTACCTGDQEYLYCVYLFLQKLYCVLCLVSSLQAELALKLFSPQKKFWWWQYVPKRNTWPFPCQNTHLMIAPGLVTLPTTHTHINIDSLRKRTLNTCMKINIRKILLKMAVVGKSPFSVYKKSVTFLIEASHVFLFYCRITFSLISLFSMISTKLRYFVVNLKVMCYFTGYMKK